MSEDFSLGTVQVSLTPIERFEEFLQSRGKRHTKPRRAIVEEVFKRHAHFDAEDLIMHLHQTVGGRRVGRSTVYRTLDDLVESGLLRFMVLGDRKVYEHDYGYPQHDHLHCQKCNKLIEFHSDEVAAIRDAVGREHQFRVVGHRLTISGICSDCRSRKRPGHSLDRV